MRSPPIYKFTNLELYKYFNEMDSDKDGCITEGWYFFFLLNKF